MWDVNITKDNKNYTKRGRKMKKQTKRLCVYLSVFIIWLFYMVGCGNNKNDIMVIESSAENSIKPCPPG